MTGAVTLERYLAIDDYGRLINPMLTIGQVQGGVAQGSWQARDQDVPSAIKGVAGSASG
jgi:aerobic carbon-monoxide dehydrogenase large subunit